MEVAIANNQTTTTTTSTATANANNNQHHSLSGVRSPFQREVREWQRIDPATGALLTGRLEADRWINGPLHSYGKKSSSSVSCNSNSSTANMQNFTSSNNSNNANNRGTHGSGSKVSLHAIVGSSNNSNDSKNGLNVATLLSTSSSATSSFNTAATAASTAWQRQQQQQIQSQQQQEPQQQPPHQQRHSRLFEQLPTFGKINFGTDFAKSRVGEAVAVADDRAEAKFDDRVTFNSTATTTTTTTDARNTLQLTPTHLQRRNLESFRHYNDDADDHHHHHHLHHYHNDDRGDYNIKNIDNYDDDDVNENNDADMRLSTRHQRRQQLPVSSSSFTNASLHRGRSISTDDLSTEWDPQSDDTTIDEPGEWKRVSKLRRSFQSPATTHLTTSDSTAPRRPLDLPASSVSVSKIRAELEQGRRLNTAMRNNNVDMAALQSILNPTTSSTTADIKPVPAQRSTFLTADSLKKIRNNLKKLSDESLYKEDFLQHQTAPVEHLEIHEVKTKPVLKTQLCRITPERTSEMNTTAPSAFKLVAAQKQSSPPAVSFNPTSKQHTTHSLESRQKYRDTSSAEWHLRRKSYGFEKMLPTEESNMFRMDASTDSGLGRSSELNAWSPTETAPAPRSTVVHFGESTRVTGLVQRRYQNQPNSPEAGSSSDDQKRHSIAFDDSQFVRKTSQVRINGIGQAELESSSQPQSYDTDSPTNGSSATQYFQRSQQKRVEFCKTEVHFAAESGRVNIVETDGKPPPTNNFRRRRRTTTSGPLQSLVKGASTTSETLTPEAKNSVALPITRFGDDNRPRTIASTTVAYKASLMDAKADTFEPSNVTITLPKIAEGLSAGSRNSYASTSGIDTTDNETDDIAGIRGILKNKPVKPKPYHLGENFETPDALWGVQLKPVGGQQLRKESVDTATTRDSPPLQALNKSVAERVHNVEKRQDLSSTVQQNGYSTKINLSLGENSPDWREQDLPKSNIMSIALHSPQATMEKTQSQTAPIARPRTTTDSTTKEPLRIIKEARGARKLREHELSFFGVPIANSKASNTATQQTTITTTSTKRTLPQRPRFREETSNSTHNEVDHSNEVVLQSSKWKLTHDRPDLLHHTEHHSSGRAAKESHTKKKSFSPVKHIQYSDEDEDTETENFYENLTNDLDAMPQKTQSMQAIKGYSRQRDLARDERILSEMTHTADQTMKALNDEAVLKDQRRRSLTRRNSKPLETIDEKSISEKISDKCIAVTVTRSTLASEAKRQTSHASRQAALSSETHTKLCRTRTSSQSSVESGSRPRSRSLSSEREYEQANAKQSARSSTKQSRHTKPTSRSSSRDSQRSSQTLGSSGDELCRRDERLRAKTKRSSGSVLTKTSTTEKLRSSEHERKEREKTGERSQQRSSRSLRERPPTHRGESSSKSKSNSTTRSSQRECVECVTDVNRTPPPQPTTRRHRNESEKRSSSATRQAATVVNKLEARSSLRLVRSMRSSQDHDSSQRSSNRSERSGTEKEKLSRSRGHSSRSAAHSNDNSKLNHHHHHHQQQQHSSSPSSTSRTRSSSEHKKSASATAPSATADNSQTHSKNASALNGISSQRQHHHHDRHHHHHQQPAQHIHSLTAATIATKQRERSGKDRK